MTIAIALFAKTTTLSLVKTRLAAQIGQDQAELFYDHCLAITRELIEETAKECPFHFTPYWALAEEEACSLPQWHDYDYLWTGPGDLGERMHHVYETLRPNHDAVMLLGTDIPQLSPRVLCSALERINQFAHDCIIGPAYDGGFFCFASNVSVPETVWTQTPYSTKKTLERFEQNLTQSGLTIDWLHPQRDIDEQTDLAPLLARLDTIQNPLAAQQKLHSWLEKSSSFSKVASS